MHLRPDVRCRPALRALGPVTAALLVLLAATPAQADGVKKDAARADLVFSGTVTSSARDTIGVGNKERKVRRLTVQVERIYQGDVTDTPVLITTTTNPEACGLGKVPRGTAWMFFVNGKDASFFANTCSGSAQASSAYVARVEKVLGAGKVLVKPPSAPPPLAYTAEETSPPTSLGRLVAPGGALTLVGLLGLVVVRRKRAQPN